MLLIGIYAGALFFPPDRMHFWDENNLESGGIGGSEIWAIELANQLIKMGHGVYVFCDCEKSHISSNGVIYVALRDWYNGDYYYISSLDHLDFVILSRRTNVPFEMFPTDTFYLMAHDPRILDADTYQDLHMDRISGIAYQSEWQKRRLIELYPGLENARFFKTSQALNPDLYADASTFNKKNKMVWSSHKVRGVKFFIERVMPLIRQEVPDFELDVTGYIEDTTDPYFYADGVNIKGCVSKSELIRLQKESKIWVYPNWGKFDNGWVIDETFCITAIENGLAENALFCADKTCFSTTLAGYDNFVGTELFDGDEFILPEEKWDEFARQLARASIMCLKEDGIRQRLGKQAKKICLQYTWENVANSFINEFNCTHTNTSVELVETEIVFMTAVLRTKTLPSILDNIKRVYAFTPNIHITWLLCVDQYNSDNQVGDIIRLCNEYNAENPLFGWYIINSGKPNQKNFGGDMFNEPLKALKQDYFPNNDNVWVYILDDDNLMTDIFLSTLSSATNLAMRKGKDIIFYNIKYDNGVCAPESYHHFPQSRFNTDIWVYYHICDPSQLLLKYSFLEEIGFYQPTGNYDTELFFNLINNRESILFPEDFMSVGSLNRYQVLYNGMVKSDNVKKIKAMAKSTLPKIATLDISTIYEGKTLALTDEQLQKIIDIL